MYKFISVKLHFYLKFLNEYYVVFVLDAIIRWNQHAKVYTDFNFVTLKCVLLIFLISTIISKNVVYTLLNMKSKRQKL